MKHLLYFVIVILSLFLGMSYTLSATNKIEENIIYLDAGHGGTDGGATIGKISEKDINFQITNHLKALFIKHGYKVILTRTGDYDLAPKISNNRKREDILKRVNLINESECILYLSIHANYYPSKVIRGAQTFYTSKNSESKSLALSIQEAMEFTLGNTNRISKNIQGKYLIDNVTKPGCLIETGFMSNEEELKLLCNPIYQEKLSYAIFIGTASYLNNI